MVNKKSRQEVRVKKHMRIRNRISGTAERPRLAVYRSNNHMYAQIIDDVAGSTLVAACTLEKEVKEQLEKVKELVLGEVNVKEMEFISETAGLITKKIKPNFKTLGKIYGKQMKEIAAALAALGQDVISEIQASETSGTGYVLNLPSGDVTLNKGDYEISSEDMPGWLVATEGTLTLALDITITDALRYEGVARELINRIQNLRKDSDFDVTDKITVKVFADGLDGEEIAASLAGFRDYVAAQTLAVDVQAAPLSESGDAPEVEWNDGNIRIRVERI